MESLKTPSKPLISSMNSVVSTSFRTKLQIYNKVRNFSASSVDLANAHQLINGKNCRKKVLESSLKDKAKVSDAELKEKWLASLSCPLPEKVEELGSEVRSNGSGAGLNWVIGIDPDVSGALALLKTDESGCSAQVFDNPHVQILVGKRVRRRLDANSIVQMLQSFNAPLGTTAYLEQSIPFPQDGKQGWWSGGFGYGMWIGILVASGFSVVPVTSLLWKNHFQLSGSRLTKDDSRTAASTLFPSLSSLLTRKKDHGRAEALLIAAYGKGLHLKLDSALEINQQKLDSALEINKLKLDSALEINQQKLDSSLEINQLKLDAALEINQLKLDASPEIKADLDLCTTLT
ncbi:hypothetical protein IFM89_028403 [Coptis chinensis]|uniref:Uncharacterized protein n=1 Tax=Coptis chinensis TaxID=261450 RepID=A0A835H7A2_9MAGN|nr:hypothetical protein IFM89_028403 [Coptis chinensis]